jgi:hypothetical protein
MTEAFTSGVVASFVPWLLVIGLVWLVCSSFVRSLVASVLGGLAVVYIFYPATFEVLLAHLQRLW